MGLLQTVLQKLGRKIPDQHPTTDENLERPVNEAHPLLHQLQERRQLLEVVIDGRQRRYQTLILAVDTERGLLWLDELFPSQRLLETGDSITLRHHREGELLTINTSIVAWGADFGASGMAVLLPDEASYQPRRHFPRLLGENLSLSGKIRTLGEEPVYGHIQDLSAGGLSILVAGNLLAQIHHGLVLPLCEVNLGQGLHIRCRARVCAFRLCRSPYRGTRISLEFVDLPPMKQQQLSRFINHLGQALDEQTQIRAA